MRERNIKDAIKVKIVETELKVIKREIEKDHIKGKERQRDEEDEKHKRKSWIEDCV